MPAYECESCGAQYSQEFVATWGTTEQTDGMGNTPKCIAMIPNEKAPPAFSGDGQLELPMQTCGGSLQRDNAGLLDEDDINRRNPLRPIRAGRKS